MINVDFLNIDNAKLVGRLLPFWARGKNISLFLQSTLKPMVSVHNNFKSWALENYIYCHITAQAMSLAWYLRYKLKSHFADENDEFQIMHGNNDLLSCYNSGIWDNDMKWSDAFLWNNKNEVIIDTIDDYTSVYAPKIIDTINYDQEDYKRDIRNILSKFMINFKKTVIVVAKV